MTISSVTADPRIHVAVSQQASRAPVSIALIDGPERVTYSDLDAAARAYAADLSALGVAPGTFVPILLPRSARLAALQLAVLKCGAAYAMVDPRWPTSHREDILSLVRPTVVVGDRSDRSLGEITAYLPRDEDLRTVATRAPAFKPPEIESSAPATVFFTSGTTGKPKGVVSPHRAVTRLFGPNRLPGFGPGHVTPQAAALPWDMYAFEMWGQLTTGGTTVITDGDHLLPGLLRELIKDAGVDTLWLTTSLFNLFVDVDIDCFTGLAFAYTGGEKLSPEHVRAFLSRHPTIPLRNGYGPAESCMLTTTRLLSLADCDVSGGVPLGRAVPGTAVHVLGENDRPCPAGISGEICISGEGLALGYLGDLNLTVSKFPVVTVAGVPVRIYRTGDVGFTDEEGILHFRGRRDTQVKISGHRIEVAEIEVTARSLPGVRDCTVVPLQTEQGQATGLALFYLADPGSTLGSDVEGDRLDEADPDPLAVRDQLAGLLPGYLVPGTARWLPAFPITPNGKLDRAALQEQARTARRGSRRRAGTAARGQGTP
jgi:amino acid adenylation domain-containing protein